MSPAAVQGTTATIQDGSAVVLRDVEDLHDADLDVLLADGLAEPADAPWAAAQAATSAREIVDPAALSAHVFGPAARLLVG